MAIRCASILFKVELRDEKGFLPVRQPRQGKMLQITRIATNKNANCGNPMLLIGEWRARQDSNLRPPA